MNNRSDDDLKQASVKFWIVIILAILAPVLVELLLKYFGV
jgi:hypothetical protein